ncbi:KOW domain-containing protein family protein [Dirofilaria immitis]|nr:KOW domain-containing protein family protein [Dirofilaria immitis]
MASIPEHYCLSGASDVFKDMSGQKSSDVKFTISTVKRNVVSVSNNILRTENNESDNDAESAIRKYTEVEKRLGYTNGNAKDWRIERLLQMKSEGKLNEKELAKLELLTEATSSSIQKNANEVDHHINKSISSVDADYNAIPVEIFGLAVLRGCGWQEGEGIGKTNKKQVCSFGIEYDLVVPLRISSKRPKGLGLGAAIMSRSDDKSLDLDAEKLKSLKKASLVKITEGIYRNLYGRIESFDEDNASVIVQLAVDNKNVRVSHYAVILVTVEEYERKTEVEIVISFLASHDLMTVCNLKSASASSHLPKNMWARPKLKVRFINKEFKNGKLYNEKVRILDAVDRENCTVEDSSGNNHTKNEGKRLMIVNGPFRGNIAVLEARDKKKHMVIARLITTDEIVTVCFDDICEYLDSFD